MKNAGYRTKYYYGGDADFTNMRSYLMSSGFEDIVADRDFPVSERLSKWGVHDHLVFRRLLDDLKAEAADSTLAGRETPHSVCCRLPAAMSRLKFHTAVWRTNV